MPYELGTIWNVTSKYIYNTLDKNIGIGTTTPICELDVYCNIAENGIKLEDKYQLKPENNKKYDLIVREDLDEDHKHLIIWYKFNKDDFTSNFTSNLFSPEEVKHYGDLITIGTRSNLQKEYYVGTGSAEINDELYYKIKIEIAQFNLTTYTYCFWLFLNEECNDDTFILKFQDYIVGTDIFYCKYYIDKLIIFKSASQKIEYTYTLNKNEWYHITILNNDGDTDTDKVIILINGIRINKDDITGTINKLSRDYASLNGIVDIYIGNISN